MTVARRPSVAWLLPGVMLAAAVPGCGPSDVSPAGGVSDGPGGSPYRAVATTGMVGDVVRNVAGDRAEVGVIMGSGVDPHLYTASRDDVARLMRADVVFYSGLHLEGKLTEVLEQVGRRKPVLAVTEAIEESSLLRPDAASAQHDPHVWMDPSAWAKCVDAVADRLAEFDPPHAAEYRANAERYAAELAELHEYGRRVLGSIPEDRRVLVTSHDAFNYFGRAFDLDVLGVQGISTESEAGLARINDLVDLLVEKRVGAVFVETSVPRKSIEALINGARRRGHEVRIGGTLFSDAMGDAGTYEGTYVGMLDHNVTTVARALGGEAPARGMQAKLGGGDE